MLLSHQFTLRCSSGLSAALFLLDNRDSRRDKFYTTFVADGTRMPLAVVVEVVFSVELVFSAELARKAVLAFLVESSVLLVSNCTTL